MSSSCGEEGKCEGSNKGGVGIQKAKGRTGCTKPNIGCTKQEKDLSEGSQRARKFEPASSSNELRKENVRRNDILKSTWQPKDGMLETRAPAEIHRIGRGAVSPESLTGVGLVEINGGPRDRLVEIVRLGSSPQRAQHGRRARLA